MFYRLILFLLILAIILFLLLGWYIRYKAYGKEEKERKKTEKKRKEAALQGLLVSCPLCKTPLLKGEDLFSRVYRPMNVSDQRCTINGCPHCYPVPQAGVTRICPVCKKAVPVQEGHHLVARLFNQANGKKHIIVTGCSECGRKDST